MREALHALVAEMVEKGILFDEAREEFERRFIQQVLERTDGNQSRAALALGVHRNTLSRKMAELRLGPARQNGTSGRPKADKRQVKADPGSKRAGKAKR
ncbi:MAG: helix-turn-helix domain-containing protein [Terriglobales bacterium]